jgi:twitching motility protein PilI
MKNSNITDPVSILKQIEDGCRRCSSGLPQKVDVSSEWSGVGFRIGSNNLVAPLGEVVEIIDYPDISAVPLTRPWVRGIANLRGNLLPVIDLNGYLNGSVAPVTSKSRVLVVDYNGIYSGLVVDEVYGLKHFMQDEFTGEDCGVEHYLQPYIRNSYRRNEKIWGVFSLFILAESPQFLRVAV